MGLPSNFEHVLNCRIKISILFDCFCVRISFIINSTFDLFQFGIFMFCTIGFSLLFSMGLYVTVMGILGPEGDIGDIRVFFRKYCARVRPDKVGSGRVSDAAPLHNARDHTG